jgi:hypothetical protein
MIKDARYDDFDTKFQWSDKQLLESGHVIGTPYGIVFAYAVWGGPHLNHTRMILVYANRTYGVVFPRRYVADAYNVRLARQFARETVARVDAAQQNGAGILEITADIE